jgi:hypothetical protein
MHYSLKLYSVVDGGYFAFSLCSSRLKLASVGNILFEELESAFSLWSVQELAVIKIIIGLI